jgi:hypothetical protein
MKRRNSLFTARTLVLGGIAAAATAVALKNRKKVAGLIGARSSEPEPYSPPVPTPPISNYDAPGPVANTATPVPAPEPVVHEGGIDERAEEAAAAAEAANIGGEVPDYAPSTLDEPVDEADRPLEEAGEGFAEGQEQTEGDLADNAEPAAGDPIEGERSVEAAIEAQDDPGSGEVLETHDHIHANEVEVASSGASTEAAPLQPETVEDGAATGGGTASGTTSAAEKSSAVWKSDEEQETAEQPAVEASQDEESDDDGSEWQTWSGRAVDR